VRAEASRRTSSPRSPARCDRAAATAKLNLALVVGPVRADGKHDVTTVLQRSRSRTASTVRPATGCIVEGFAGRHARARRTHRARARGGRQAALARAHLQTDPRRGRPRRRQLRRRHGAPARERDARDPAATTSACTPSPADSARTSRSSFATGRSSGRTRARPPSARPSAGLLRPPPRAERRARNARPKTSTRLRRTARADGYDRRRATLLDALENVRRPRDLAALPPNDLASSPLADELRALGAFRADVTGAGPTVYGLLPPPRAGRRGAQAIRGRGRTGSRHLLGTVDAWCSSSNTARVEAGDGSARTAPRSHSGSPFVEAALVIFGVFPRWPKPLRVPGSQLLALLIVVGRTFATTTNPDRALGSADVSQLFIVALPVDPSAS
jgi:hypothetical protein